MCPNTSTICCCSSYITHKATKVQRLRICTNGKLAAGADDQGNMVRLVQMGSIKIHLGYREKYKEEHYSDDLFSHRENMIFTVKVKKMG